MVTHKDMTKEIVKGLVALEKRIAVLESEIAKLTQQGTTQAKFYVRRDKSKKNSEILETYYLLHPMRDGKRKKEYVGRSKYEIAKAQDRMDRFAKRKELIASLDILQAKHRKAKTIMKQLAALVSDGSFVSSCMARDY